MWIESSLSPAHQQSVRHTKIVRMLSYTFQYCTRLWLDNLELKDVSNHNKSLAEIMFVGD